MYVFNLSEIDDNEEYELRCDEESSFCLIRCYIILMYIETLVTRITNYVKREEDMPFSIKYGLSI